jgi:RNA polymerase sigma factor (sigma-70 family)
LRPVESDEDHALLARWRAGDADAGNALFERHFSALLRFFRNKTDRNLEDLVQDTFLACVQGRDRVREEGSFRAYLFGTARYLLYGHVRKLSGRAIDPEVDAVADLAPGISTAFAKHREQRLLLRALQSLPIEFQVTLELYYWEGLSGPELARTLGVPEATVRSRLSRGSTKLRRELERLAESPELRESTLGDLEKWLAGLRAHMGAESRVAE